MSSNGEGGYICEFRVKQDNNMIWPEPNNGSPHNCIRFLFRVQYILRKRPDFGGADEVVDSSGSIYTLDFDQPLVKEHLEMFMALDFARWGLPYRVREKLYRDVAERVHRMKADPENVGVSVLHVDVAIDICTIQREGEDLEVTRSRLIKSRSYAFVSAEDLLEYQVSSDLEFNEVREEQSLLVARLQRVKVEGGEFVQECSICLETPGVGAEICYLPCTHVYHFACIVRWLDKSHVCPFCRALISN